MKIPIKWLKEYVNVSMSPEKLADILTMSGTEVEKIGGGEENFKDIVVGEIRKIKKHPSADRLQITEMFVGKQTLKIVCGAFNIEVGQKVPVALVGAMLGEFEIEEVEIRGIKSHGMLCSEADLGISDDHSGIMILDPRAKVGDNVSRALNIGDTVLEAEITPNRGDCLSMIGIAREVSSVVGGKIKYPKVELNEASEKTSNYVKVEVKDKKLCPRYVARVIQGVKVGPSPKWMQDRLSSSGIRPINNIVDTANYVMMETGQPLHAFDIEKIGKTNGLSKIIVRKAKKGEKIETLDGTLRELDINDLIIADSDKAIAIAGVMGGANSEVGEKTNTIILESANFDPVSVRKTSFRHSLRSEASNRFEKGLSLKVAEDAVDRAAALLSNIAGGEVLSGSVDVGTKKDKTKRIKLNIDRIDSLVGVTIPKLKIIQILESLGFSVSEKAEELSVKVPHFRLDISIEEDLIEEIVRIYGYDNIPSTLPETTASSYEENKEIKIFRRIREIFTGLGFFEIYSYSFTDEEKAGSGKGELVEIANPLSQDQRYLRSNLLGSLMDIVSKNRDYKGGESKKVYEISPVYKTSKSKIVEETRLSGLVSAINPQEALSEAKGALDILFSKLNIDSVSYKEGAIFFGKEKIGSLVVLNDDNMPSFKLKLKGICFFEFDIGSLIGISKDRKFKKIPRFPGSERDLTFVFDESIRISDIQKTIESSKSNILDKTEIVDVYRGKGLGNKKSVSIRFYYQSWGRTLRDNEVDDDQKKIIKRAKTLGGVLRDGNKG